jgi:hypothetical protein
LPLGYDHLILGGGGGWQFFSYEYPDGPRLINKNLIWPVCSSVNKKNIIWPDLDSTLLYWKTILSVNK